MSKDEVIMTFGRYSGRFVHTLPSSYLYWLIETFEGTSKHAEIIEAAIEEHNYREHYGHYE